VEDLTKAATPPIIIENKIFKNDIITALLKKYIVNSNIASIIITANTDQIHLHIKKKMPLGKETKSYKFVLKCRNLKSTKKELHSRLKTFLVYKLIVDFP